MGADFTDGRRHTVFFGILLDVFKNFFLTGGEFLALGIRVVKLAERFFVNHNLPLGNVPHTIRVLIYIYKYNAQKGICQYFHCTKVLFLQKGDLKTPVLINFPFYANL